MVSESDAAPRGLRMAVADEDTTVRQAYQQQLPVMGHQVVAVAENGRQLVEQCRAERPGLVLTEIHLPDLDGIAAAEEINRDQDIPVILVTGRHDAQTLARSVVDHIMAYLTKPVKPADLQAAITLAVHRFHQYQQVRAEAAGLQQALEDRKAVERTKGVVMRRLGISEEEAYRRLRTAASNRNQKIVEVARELLEADTAFQRLEGKEPGNRPN